MNKWEGGESHIIATKLATLECASASHLRTNRCSCFFFLLLFFFNQRELLISVRWPLPHSAACDWRAVPRRPLDPDPRCFLSCCFLRWWWKTEPWRRRLNLRAQEGSRAATLWLGWWRRAPFSWRFGSWWGCSGRGWPRRPKSHLGPPSRWSLRQRHRDDENRKLHFALFRERRRFIFIKYNPLCFTLELFLDSLQFKKDRRDFLKIHHRKQRQNYTL